MPRQSRSSSVQIMSNYPVHVAFPGRLIFVGFGSIGQGVLPLILRHIGIQADQITIVTAEESRPRRSRPSTACASSSTPLTRENYRHVLEPLRRPRRFPAQPVGRRLERRADRVLLGEGRALPRHLHRALGRRLHRPDGAAGAAHQLRAARGGAGAARDDDARADRGAHARREPGPGVALRQAGAAQHRRATPASSTATRRTRDDWAQLAQTLGVKVIHIAERDTQVAPQPQGAGRVRQHLVGGRLRRRGLPAGRARLGHAREATSRATRKQHDFGCGARST